MNDYYNPPSCKSKWEAYKELAERLSWAGHHECGPTTEKDARAASSAIKELLCEIERANTNRNQVQQLAAKVTVSRAEMNSTHIDVEKVVKDRLAKALASHILDSSAVVFTKRMTPFGDVENLASLAVVIPVKEADHG